MAIEPKRYRPARDGRFEYITDAIHHIEEVNCSKGCTQPRNVTTEEWPGGDCPIIVALLDETPHESLLDMGDHVRCVDRKPIPAQREELPLQWS